MDIQKRALIYADNAHSGQTRKYTGEAYIFHCISVARMVKRVKHSPEMIAAAYLHDTVEDTSVTIHDIKDNFGLCVASYLEVLTDRSKMTDGNRAVRKEIDMQAYQFACEQVQTIKIADCISNANSILRYDKKFSFVYMREMALLSDYLSDGDALLFGELSLIIRNFQENN